MWNGNKFLISQEGKAYSSIQVKYKCIKSTSMDLWKYSTDTVKLILNKNTKRKIFIRVVICCLLSSMSTKYQICLKCAKDRKYYFIYINQSDM